MSRHRHFYQNELKKYPFLPLLCALLLGILTQPLLSKWIAIVWVLVAGIFVLVLAGALHQIRSTDPHIQPLRTVCLYLSVVILGITLAYYQDVRNVHNWYGNHLADATELKIVASAAPTAKERTLFIPAIVTGMHTHQRWIKTEGNIKLYIYKSESIPNIREGDVLFIPAHSVSAIRNSGNPFEFDYARYAAKQGLYHQAFCGMQDIAIVPGTDIPKMNPIASLRQNLLNTIRKNIHDSTTASLVEATILNERAMLHDDLWQAYATTGIVHIIAISGMHVTILFQILLFFLLWIKNKELEWIKYFVAIPLVWMYIILTGFPASAVRAGAMFTLLAFGIKLNRETNAINILLASAFLLLCYNPYWIFDTGFQLSFMAVLSILLFYPRIFNIVYPPNRIVRFFWSTLAVSLAAQILTFPLSIYYFHQFPVWVLVANIPATIFSTVLMILALFILLLGSFTSCVWLGNILASITEVFHVVIRWLAAYTPSYFQSLFIDTPTFWMILFFIGAVTFTFLIRKRLAATIALMGIVAFVIDYLIQIKAAKSTERLVIYNTSRRSYLDVFQNGTVVHYSNPGDKVDKKTYNYVLLPAKLGYKIAQESSQSFDSVHQYHIGTKSVVLLNTVNLDNLPQSLPCNYLIVTNKCILQADKWRQCFAPEKIIIDGSLPRWKAHKWIDELRRWNMPVHWVQADGAFILEE